MKVTHVLRSLGCWAFVVFGLALAGCGGGDKPSSPAGATSSPSSAASSIAPAPTQAGSRIPLDNLCQLFPTGFVFRLVPPAIGASDGTFRSGCQGRMQCETDVNGFCKININVTRDDGAMYRKFASAYSAKTPIAGLGDEAFLVTNPAGTIIMRRGPFSVYATIDGDVSNLQTMLTTIEEAMRKAT